MIIPSYGNAYESAWLAISARFSGEAARSLNVLALARLVSYHACSRPFGTHAPKLSREAIAGFLRHTLVGGAASLMNGRIPTAAEKTWLDKCLQIECLICEIFNSVLNPFVEIHHIDGQRKPNAHFKTLSLCIRHHRVADHIRPKRWVSRHGDGKRAFEKEYCTEKELLEAQKMRVANLERNMV